MAEQVITTAGLPATPEQPAVFIAGNRKLDKIQLENSLSRYFDTFVSAYLSSWGEKNTQEVRLAYSNMMNAIHDGKVSMNIDGSLQISDGSIVNSPNKKGFDANAAVAYFVKRVSDTLPDLTVQKPKGKKYTGNTFRGNFVRSLTPNDPASLTNEWWNNNWINLDLEVTDESGNRSRPYTNRLKVFLDFLDREIANLDNYTEAGEEYGDIDTVKQRMLDLKERLADGDISAEDNLALTRLGFEPSFFTTLGTPKTEEEVAAEKEAAEKAKAEEAAAAAKAEEERRANVGVLNIVSGLTNWDSVNNPQAYADHLALNYGVGKAGFDAVNQTILGLLNKAYTGVLAGSNNGLTESEKRQLGNFIHFIRANNPAFQNALLTLEELDEFRTHESYNGENVFKLPWKTQDGRSIYADDNGKLYFLKPSNHAELASELTSTGYDYKTKFLSGTTAGAQAQRTAELEAEHNRHIFEDLSDQDIEELSSIIPDIASIIDPEPFSAAGLALVGAGMRHHADAYRPGNSGLSNIGEHLLDYGIAAVSALPFAGDAALAWRAYNGLKKFLPAILTAAAAWLSPEMIASVKKAIEEGPTSLTLDDWRNIQLVITLGVEAGRALVSKNRSGSLTEPVGRVKVSDGTRSKVIEIHPENVPRVKEEFRKAGNDNRQKAEIIKQTAPEQLEGLNTDNLSVVSKTGWRSSKRTPDLIAKTEGIVTRSRPVESTALTLSRLREGNWYSRLKAQGIENSLRFREKFGSELNWIDRMFKLEDYSMPRERAEETPRTGEETPRTGEEGAAAAAEASAAETPRTGTAGASSPGTSAEGASPGGATPQRIFNNAHLRVYDRAKPGLTPEELAITERIRNNWAASTKEERSQFAKLVSKGTRKAQELARQEQLAKSGGVDSGSSRKAVSLEAAKKLEGGEKLLTKGKEISRMEVRPFYPKINENSAANHNGRGGLSSSDRIYSTDLGLRGKQVYLVKHNGKFMLWRDEYGYMTLKLAEAEGLEMNIPEAIRAVLENAPQTNKRGGKFQRFLELKRRGGIIKAQSGIKLNTNVNWADNVFSAYSDKLLELLKDKGDEFAAYLNEMQRKHHDLYEKAKASGDFLTTAYLDDDVRKYLQSYSGYPISDTEKYNFNIGIKKAYKAGRYNRLGTSGTGLDWADTEYVPDGLYSGETDDRRILGRDRDFDADLGRPTDPYSEFAKALNDLGYHMYLDRNTNYYMIGKYGKNGEMLDLDGNPVVQFLTDAEKQKYPGWLYDRVDENGNPLPPDEVPDNAITLPEDETPVDSDGGAGNVPELATPGINGSIVTGDRLADLTHNKLDYRKLLPELVTTGLGISNMLGHIITTNRNYKTAVEALRLLRLLDPALKYHQVMDDYAGNQLAANQAAAVRNRTSKAISSDRAFNEARTLEGENKALDLVRQQATLDLKVRLLHALMAELYGNENRAARIDVGNKNGQLMYDLVQKLGNAELSKRLANWTSVSNAIMEQKFKANLKLDEYKVIEGNWKAQLLGKRNVWINRRLQSDPEYLRALAEYDAINNNSESTQEQKSAATRNVRRRIAEVELEAGREWDLEYARLYNLPYYEYQDPFERSLAIAARYGNTPTDEILLNRKGGTLDALVEVLKSLNSRANSQDVSERERLRARKADADRFMKSIWKAMDMYILQTKKSK